jgi:hypothetical protein
VAIPFGEHTETCPVKALREWLDAFLDAVHLDLHLRVRGIIERPARCGIKIDGAGYLVRKAAAD